MSAFRKNRYYRLFVWLGLLACILLILWLGTEVVTTPKWLQIDDFVEYWSAGNLNFHGGNPYDPGQLLPLQQAAGRFFGVPVMMWNPPWMLLVAMPISLLPYAISRVIWFVIFVILLMLAVNMTWEIFNGNRGLRWVGWLVGFTFVPVLQNFRVGQTGILLLLGSAGFLYFMQKKKPYLAGIFLSFLLVKPHILYLLLIAVGIWTLYEKQFRVFLGICATLIAATFIVSLVNPGVVTQYFYAIQNYPPQDWATPTIGGITRLLVGTQNFWMQFIPTLAGLIWMAFYWYQRRAAWDWVENTPFIILVSVLTSPYGWIFDQPVSLIPILQIFLLLLPISKNNYTQYAVLISYILLNALLLPLGNQIWQFWLAPSLLIWYLISKKNLVDQD